MKKMKKILLLFTLMVSFFTYSQTDTIESKKLNEFEVLGIRSDSKSPSSQKVLIKDEYIKVHQGMELPFILDKTPSITTQSDGGGQNGYCSFRIRGIDQTRINMSLNGVPLNEPEDQGVYFSNYPNFITNINSIQIQRGVGTSSYGTASYGGSINFESKNGIDKEFTSQIGYGSFNTKRTNISYGSGLRNNISFYGGISLYNTDGYKYNSFGMGYSSFMNIGYYGSKNILKITGFNGKSLNGMSWLPVSECDIKKDPKINYNRKGEDDDFTQSFIQLQYVRTLSKKSTISSTIYYNRLDGIWDMSLDSINMMRFGLSSNFYGIMCNYKLDYRKLKLNIGLHANTYNRRHIGTIVTELYNNIGYKNEYSSFFKASYDLKKFTLSCDLQNRNVYFKYNGDVKMSDIKWTFFNPRFGFTYSLNKNVNYYLSIGKSNREPTRNDMFGGSDNLVTINIINPESVIDYELGSNIKLSKIDIQYNLYYMDFKNEITLYGFIGSNGLPLMTTVDKSYRSGLEFDLKYKIHKYISITNNTNYSLNNIKSDGYNYNPLYTPNIILNQGISYDNNKLYVDFTVKYQSKSYISFDGTSIPSFYTLNSNISLKIKKCCLMVQIVNLNNKQYYTMGYRMNNTNYLFVNQPLSFYLTLKLSL